MSDYADRFWTSRDGLKLHYRDYAGRSDRPPLICLPGLTRNARDAEPLANRLAGEWRVLCPEMRGRGDSAYAKDSATYNPVQYVEDLGELYEQAELGPAVLIGTSLGGLMAMITALGAKQRIAGVVLNDVGPELMAEGLERIRDYVGQGRNFPTWMHAARALEESQAMAYPDFETADWLAMAKRVMLVTGNGRIHFDYDMKIAEPFNQPGGEAGVDLWPCFDALQGLPLLLLRGELSDVLSAETHRKMAQRIPDSEAVTVPRVGHAPTMDEPAARAAIDRLLARIA